MSYARKNATIATIVWTVILCGLIAVILGLGVEQFTDPDRSFWRALTAAIILPGFLFNIWLGWRSKRGKAAYKLDERDEAVAHRASEITLIVVTAVIYLTSIILYETHLDSGTLPTGWLYLIAYGTMALVSLVHAVATLIVDSSGVTDG